MLCLTDYRPVYRPARPQLLDIKEKIAKPKGGKKKKKKKKKKGGKKEPKAEL